MNIPKWTLFCAIMLLGSHAGASSAGAPNSFLDSPVSDVMSSKNYELKSLCQKLNTPCGVERRRCSDLPESPTITRMKNTTLRTILDQTVKLNPGYRWVVRNGVVNLEPSKRTNLDLLSRKLKTVSIHGITAHDAFHKVLEQAGIHLGGGSMGFGSGIPAQTIVELELRETTVRDAFNAIAKLDGQVLWSFCSDKPEKSAGALGLLGWGMPKINSGAKKSKAP